MTAYPDRIAGRATEDEDTRPAGLAPPGAGLSALPRRLDYAFARRTGVILRAAADRPDRAQFSRDGGAADRADTAGWPDHAMRAETPHPATDVTTAAPAPGGQTQSDPDAMECAHREDAPLSALIEAQRCAGVPLRFVPVTQEAFETALSTLYRDSATEAAQVAADDEPDLSALAETAASVDDLLDRKDDAPVVRLINALLMEAIKDGASDVHVEIAEARLVVRFRVDGVLREVLEPRRALAPLLASRLKIMGKLDISEKRLPQDGRVSLKVGGHALDVRISTLPSQFGERIVLRLLDREQAGLGIPHLGLSDRDRTTFEDMIAVPEGLVLVTGPTGSGKTTTLYAALNHLNDRHRNILTVEDPIEYTMDGIGQMQVDPRTDLTFARGLRALLRQDPDVIMVGEIRDAETARIAVEAAMTGHLVLSTLHTNTAVGAVSRLLDMGVEPYLLAPMVRGLMAQRLVRRLCPDCAAPHPLSAADAARLSGALPEGTVVHAPVGCARCAESGYRGRLGLYEVIAGSARLGARIHDRASEAELTAEARRDAPGILQDGIAKLRAGQTSVAEVARAVRDETGGGAG